jgi:hypothetical protein
MTEAGKVPVKADETAGATSPARRPLEALRREMDRLFDEVGGEFWRYPFRRSLMGEPMFRRELTTGKAPAVPRRAAARCGIVVIQRRLPGTQTASRALTGSRPLTIQGT